MKPLIFAAALFTTAVTFAAVPALAASADADSCRAMSQQVGSALSAASGDVAAARAEQRQGLAACNAGLYANGVNHYQKALSLAGK